MLTVNIHEAKTQLSRLLDRAARGEPFIIAKAGKPLVKVVPLETPEAGQDSPARLHGWEIAVPDDFDRMGEAEIGQLFRQLLVKLLLDTHYRCCGKAGQLERLPVAARG